jgi:hypothetical protein
MGAMWKAWQGRRTKPIHSYGGHPLLTMWSGYMMQFPYYTIAPSNSDPTYAELFKQSWLADWSYYNNTAGSQNATAGNRGRYGLGEQAPSVAIYTYWCTHTVHAFCLVTCYICPPATHHCTVLTNY